MNEKNLITSHPERNLLMACARGHCDWTESVLIEAHLAFCTSCSGVISEFREDLTKDFSSVPEQADMPPDTGQAAPDLFDRIQAKISSLPARTSCRDLGIPEGLLHELPDRKSWRWLSFWPARGRVAFLGSDINGSYDLFVGIIEGAGKTPGHSHNHKEQTLPLLGEYVSGGRIYRTGDWSEMKPGEKHEPSSTEGNSCVCLIRSHRKGFRFVGLSWWRNILLGLAVTAGDLGEKIRKWSGNSGFRKSH